ncbi:hypothetical protein [Paenibacillus sp. GM2]|uniref:hypothetical protein n=1 Tax=Paenibacillus sp. GM2 TaxID=1622070 RepID=UPI000837F843|nr:hypothetical protein [Paenibacillus sp. GM2]
MTEPHNELQSYSEDNHQLIRGYQDTLIRQVEMALQSDHMEPDVYLNFLSKVCKAETSTGIYDHFEVIFDELVDYHEGRLQERIIKGAEFIESIGPHHPKYEAAVQRYNMLCEQLQQARRRARERGSRKRVGLRDAL